MDTVANQGFAANAQSTKDRAYADSREPAGNGLLNTRKQPTIGDCAEQTNGINAVGQRI